VAGWEKHRVKRIREERRGQYWHTKIGEWWPACISSSGCLS